MIWFVFCGLLILTMINYYISMKDLLNPAVVFNGIFMILSFIDCVANIFWNMDLQNVMTLVVFFAGALIFTVMNYVFLLRKNIPFPKQSSFKELNINPLWALLVIFLDVLLIYENYNYINAVAAAAGVGSTFFDNMVYYKTLSTFGDMDDALVQSTMLRSLVVAICPPLFYVGMYIFIRNYELAGRKEYLWMFTIFLYATQSLMRGERSEFFQLVTAAIFIWYFCKKRKYGSNFSNAYILKKLVLVFLCLASFFVSFMYITGRTEEQVDSSDVIQGLFGYTGAPLFNFDTFIGSPWHSNSIVSGGMTFLRLIPWLGQKFGIRNWIYTPDQPMQVYNNIWMGNVYTTYYSSYYDFQFIGTIILITLMALICMCLYRRACRLDIGEAKIQWIIILNAYIFNSIFMSGFSSRFYESVISITMIYFVFIVLVIAYLMNHVTFHLKLR